MTSNILAAINAITSSTFTVNGVAVVGIKPQDMPSNIHITPCHFIPMTAVQVDIQRISMGGRARYIYTVQHLMLWKALAQNSIDDAFPELLNWIASYNDNVRNVALPSSISVDSISNAETTAITYPAQGEVTFAGVEIPLTLIESV